MFMIFNLLHIYLRTTCIYFSSNLHNYVQLQDYLVELLLLHTYVHIVKTHQI